MNFFDQSLLSFNRIGEFFTNCTITNGPIKYSIFQIISIFCYIYYFELVFEASNINCFSRSCSFFCIDANIFVQTFCVLSIGTCALTHISFEIIKITLCFVWRNLVGRSLASSLQMLPHWWSRGTSRPIYIHRWSIVTTRVFVFHCGNLGIIDHISLITVISLIIQRELRHISWFWK